MTKSISHSQHGVRAAAAQLFYILGAVHSALGDEYDFARNERAQPQTYVHIHLEGFQVAVVDADDARARAERQLRLRLVVNLDERREIQLVREGYIVAQRRAVSQRNYKQHGGGPERRGRVYHVLVNREILAQHGDARLARYLAQIFVAALEPEGLRQARYRGRTRRLVASRDVEVGEILGDEPLRRRGALHLADERNVAAAQRVLEGARSPRLRRLFRGAAHIRERRVLFVLRDADSRPFGYFL